MSPIDELYVYDYSIAYTTKQVDDQLKYEFKILDEKGTPYEYKNGHYYHAVKNTGNIDDEEEIAFDNLYCVMKCAHEGIKNRGEKLWKSFQNL